MQYLKDEVREKILKEALKEFDKSGYEGASIRNIVRNASTSVGNFYKYFQSKDDLYEKLIGSVYYDLIGYLEKFDKVKFDDNTENICYWLIDKMVNMMKNNSVEISVLINKSLGSKYENCKTTFVDYVTNTVTKNIEYQLGLNKKRLKDNFIIYILSWSLIEGVAVIVEEKKEGEEVRKYILNLVEIFYSDIINKVESEEV
ncbi:MULTISPECIES: TetR/AcrR family transcriptional regulator [Clostridium]|uniref:TetR/AcrR family transcriptional regulator n=1 Tax=Clostridium TaxID=1485 RepID=UPI00069CD90E|nr:MULTISPECIES: TetR/AcrR family transcriptional regulator [Clostridium]KOF55579.1 TetR family transcriptional regulator [Clostridium sp. DMHC 10]MCD2347116.1 TetR/AcrR family transcriptional regulator [Clostridium guangxiense]